MSNTLATTLRDIANRLNSMAIFVLLSALFFIVWCAPATAQDISPWKEEFDSGSSVPGGWEKRWKSANGSPFANIWLPGHVEVPYEGDYLRLRLDDQDDEGTPCFPNNPDCGIIDPVLGTIPYEFAAGEYRTNSRFGYGCYEARLKATCNEGVIASFFLFRDEDPYWPVPEIDWEFFGDSCDPDDADFQHAHTDFVDGRDYPGQPDGELRHPQEVSLGFDPTADFHTYGICWIPNSSNTASPPTTSIVKWYADDMLKRQEIVDFTDTYGRCDDPTELCAKSGMKVMINLWPTDDTWNEDPALVGVGPGVFDYPNTPIFAEYDWMSYSAQGSTNNTCQASDVDRNNQVNSFDLIFVATAWLTDDYAPVLDVNGDDRVDINDIGRVMGWWGMACF